MLHLWIEGNHYMGDVDKLEIVVGSKTFFIYEDTDNEGLYVIKEADEVIVNEIGMTDVSLT